MEVEVLAGTENLIVYLKIELNCVVTGDTAMTRKYMRLR